MAGSLQLDSRVETMHACNLDEQAITKDGRKQVPQIGKLQLDGGAHYKFRSL
jgi:hypothetical protein